MFLRPESVSYGSGQQAGFFRGLRGDLGQLPAQPLHRGLGLLGLAMKELPLGTAYAIWTGVGAVGTVIAGIILFGESMALFRLASVALIICGLIGLKIST